MGDQTVDVDAEKVGVVGNRVEIAKQSISAVTEVTAATVIINNYAPTQPSTKVSKSQDTSENPYKGLAHFGPEDTSLFFGRDDLVESLQKTVSDNTFTAIIGPSGSGKSSLALAGVAPRLAVQDDWLFSYFRVSDSSLKNPFLALMQALITFSTNELDETDRYVQAKKSADYLEAGDLTIFDIQDQIRKNHPQKRLLLIADQFEELFTAGVEEDTQKRFISLLEAIGNYAPPQDTRSTLSILLTMRADFLERAASFATFAPLIDRCSHIIGPMQKEQLRLAIEEPARLRGVTFEPGLTETILQDAGSNQGNLPLVEFTLSLLWDRQENNEIGLAAYHDLGRIKGALTQHAQAIYDMLSAKEQGMAQRIFTQLVKVGSGADDTRRIALKTDFQPEDWKLIQRFANENHRLVVTNKKEGVETAEIVHEALIQHWPLFRKWIKEDTLFLIWLEGLRLAIDQWQKHDRDNGSLLRGVALQQALEWQASKKDRLSEQQHAFIEQSQNYHEKNERNRKRLLYFGWTLAAAVITVLSLMGFYLKGSLEQANVERDKQLISQSRFLAGLSNDLRKRGNTRQAVLLALEALPDYTKQTNQRRPFVTEAYEALCRNLGLYIPRLELPEKSNLTSYAVLSRDGQYIVIPSDGYKSQVWNVMTGEKEVVLNGVILAKTRVDVSSDGQSIVTVSNDKTARVWNTATGEQRLILNGHEAPVYHATFSPDGQSIVTASRDETARVWDAATGEERLILKGHIESVYHATFSPDGQFIVTASSDKTVRVWDATSGKELVILRGHNEFVYHATFSPDGQSIVTVSNDKTARVWNTATGEQRLILNGHEAPVYHATFSPYGQSIVTASRDETARVWDAATGEERAVLRGHNGPVYHATFSPDGQSIVTASRDKTARVWDATTGQERAVLRGHNEFVYRAIFSPDGQSIVTTSGDKTARVWDVAMVEERTVLSGHNDPVYHATFSPDGQTIVAVSRDGTVRVWDAATGEERTVLWGHNGPVYHATFSPDGQSIVTASSDKTARVWDVTTGQERAVLRGHEAPVYHATFSPDGQSVVTASVKAARLWDAATGVERAVLGGHEGLIFHTTFNPDGQSIVTTSGDKALVWDAATGEERAVLRGHEAPVYHATFSPDGQSIVTASDDKTARVWDATTGQERAVLRGHNEFVYRAIFSPDGQSIVTTSGDKTARVWDAATGDERLILKGHIEPVYHATFSPDGQSIVTASRDKTVRVWDVKTGFTLLMFPVGDDVTQASFSPDGMRIMVASSSGASIWPYFETSDLVEKFRALNIPPLTAEERKQFYLD